MIAPERPASGSWRIADGRDRDLIAEWFVAFHDEATPESPAPDAGDMADRLVSQVGRTGYVWEDRGEVVSLVGAGERRPTASASDRSTRRPTVGDTAMPAR